MGAALAVDPSEPRVGPAGGGESVEDAQILEHLLTARLDVIDGKGQPRGAGTADHHVGR
ncbi:hypothetical protein ACTXG6_17340 [Pseudonocardia sp. Cha107L01]|uniref:hypothetical protein n=1 Tax=Pseudonocardia sp. Cha107L01 TaxID=3457576 RepID=UPI00403EEE5A